MRFTVDLPRRVYYRGEQVQGKLVLKYYHGTPISGRTVEYRLGDDRWFTGETDANGEVAFDLPTQRYSESQAIGLVARCAERNLTTGATIQLATRGFEVSVATPRNVYVAGETFDATVSVADAAGKPLAQDLKLEVLRVEVAQGRTSERLVQTHDVKTEGQEGKVGHTLRLETAGQYAIRATGVDRFGNTVSGSTGVMVSGEKDSVRLRILSDKHNYKTGETAKVQLHWREKPALALVTYEGASILGYRMIELKPGANALDVVMDEKLAPNFQLAVAVMEGNRFHAADSVFRVARRLNIALKPSAASLRPGEPLTVEIEATDSQGKPVSAEVSLGLIQQNLLDVFPTKRNRSRRSSTEASEPCRSGRRRVAHSSTSRRHGRSTSSCWPKHGARKTSCGKSQRRPTRPRRSRPPRQRRSALRRKGNRTPRRTTPRWHRDLRRYSAMNAS